MREIKFRAWDKEENKWRYSTDSDHIAYFWQFVDDYLDSETRKTLTEYTGLKDKNGKEIYEGDIVEAWKYNTPENKFTLEIVWHPDDAGFKFHLVGDIHEPIDQYSFIEVIGNIYENPELIGGK